MIREKKVLKLNGLIRIQIVHRKTIIDIIVLHSHRKTKDIDNENKVIVCLNVVEFTR